MSEELNIENTETLVTKGFTLCNDANNLDFKRTSLEYEAIEEDTTSKNLFYVNDDNAQIIVIDFSFIISDGENKPEMPMFNIEKGTLDIRNCEFSEELSGQDATAHSSSIIYLSNGNLCISESICNDLKRSEGNGGFLEATINNDCSLSIINVEFVDCSTENGNGGALWIYQKAEGSFTISGVEGKEATFSSCSLVGKGAIINRGGAMFLKIEDESKISLSHIVFDKSSDSDNKANFGKDYYIISSSLPSISIILNNNDVLSTNTLSLDAMGSSEDISFEDIPLHLLLSTTLSSDSVYIDEKENIINNYCGVKDCPCTSISDAYGRITCRNYNILIIKSELKGETKHIEFVESSAVTIKPEVEDASKVTLPVKKIEEGEEPNIDEKVLFNIEDSVTGS